jgi:endonuclease/exonuclease/phosphatase family metal-dependent hydrolase
MKKTIKLLCIMLILLPTSPLLGYKLVSLNIWGGHIRKPLLEFVKSNQDIDIFCFQEVYHNAQHKISADDKEVTLNIFSEIQAHLPEHQAYFLPVVAGIYGIGMFVQRDIKVISHGEVITHKNPIYEGRGPTHGRSIQWIECQSNGNKFYVINVHGLWNGKGKTDSPARILQSKRIRQFMDSLEHPIVLCGDFNLKPDTESMKILDAGMNNMITLHNILSTRTTLYKKAEKFADYIITSPEIKVNTFTVMPDEVSDHAPLLLDFELEAQKQLQPIDKAQIQDEESQAHHTKTILD